MDGRIITSLDEGCDIIEKDLINYQEKVSNYKHNVEILRKDLKQVLEVFKLLQSSKNRIDEEE